MSTSEFAVKNQLNLLADKVGKRQQNISEDYEYASELRTARVRRERIAKHAYYMRCEKRLENCYTMIAVLLTVTFMLIVHIVA